MIQLHTFHLARHPLSQVPHLLEALMGLFETLVELTAAVIQWRPLVRKARPHYLVL